MANTIQLTMEMSAEHMQNISVKETHISEKSKTIWMLRLLTVTV